MRRWLKVLLAVLAALVVLLGLNTMVLDSQTKTAQVTVSGAKIMRLSGGDLQVLDRGPRGAPAIVLLHCFTCSINWWQKEIPMLDKGHRVIAIDLLGHGGSEKPSGGYSMQAQAQLVAGALGQLGVSKATVVGHSLGGTVAVALARQSPDLVGRLVLVDQAPDSSYGGLDLLAEATFVPVLGEALWRVKMDWSIRNGLQQAFAPGYHVPDQFVDDVKRMTYSAYADSGGEEDDYTSQQPLDARLRSAHIPLLVIFGARDQIYDARKALSAYADIPGAQTSLIQGSGHSPNVEKPAQTAGLILRFAQPLRATANGPRPSPTRPCAQSSKNHPQSGARRGGGQAARGSPQARCRKASRNAGTGQSGKAR